MCVYNTFFNVLKCNFHILPLSLNFLVVLFRTPRNHRTKGSQSCHLSGSGRVTRYSRSITEKMALPSRGVPFLIKPHLFSRHTNERGLDEEVQEFPAVDGLHGIAKAHVAGAQGMVHVLQPMGHRIDGIDDKAHLTVLDVVFFQAFIACNIKTDCCQGCSNGI